MADQSGSWYVRARGRTIGPFTWVQLESLRDRGQLARFHEVSQDRQAWMAAANLSQLFAQADPGADSLRSSGSSFAVTDVMAYGIADDARAQPPAGGDQDQPAWFVARDGAQHGPLVIAEMRRMAASGEMNAYTQVWTKGMASWVPAHQVPELGLGTPASGSSPDPARYAPAQAFNQTPARMSGLAIASLVLGIVWLCGLGSLLATIFGAIALSQISRSRGQLEGKGLAIAGLVLGIFGLSLFALPFVTSFLAALLHQTQENRF